LPYTYGFAEPAVADDDAEAARFQRLMNREL
jgi:hypothetical protein